MTNKHIYRIWKVSKRFWTISGQMRGLKINWMPNHLKLTNKELKCQSLYMMCDSITKSMYALRTLFISFSHSINQTHSNRFKSLNCIHIWSACVLAFVRSFVCSLYQIWIKIKWLEARMGQKENAIKIDRHEYRKRIKVVWLVWWISFVPFVHLDCILVLCSVSIIISNGRVNNRERAI